jgi:hypothetical protein
MRLPLSPIENLALFFATLFAARLMATRMPASIASYAVIALMFALWYLGPLLCGREWYDVSFVWGACIGGFGQMAYSRKIGNGDEDRKRADLRWQQIQMSLVFIMIALIAFVVMLATGH